MAATAHRPGWPRCAGPKTVHRNLVAGSPKPSLHIRVAAVEPLVITIDQPADQSQVHMSPFTVTGTMSHPVVVTANGMEALAQGDHFAAATALNEGLNSPPRSSSHPVGRPPMRSPLQAPPERPPGRLPRLSTRRRSVSAVTPTTRMPVNPAPCPGSASMPTPAPLNPVSGKWM